LKIFSQLLGSAENANKDGDAEFSDATSDAGDDYEEAEQPGNIDGESTENLISGNVYQSAGQPDSTEGESPRNSNSRGWNGSCTSFSVK